MSKKLDLKDREFERLTVLRESKNRASNGEIKWWCQCSCGSDPIEVKSTNLVSGHSRSCGCISREKQVKRLRTHGESRRTTEYIAWGRMKDRCYNENMPAYHNYGGRGIKVCDRWISSYENFLEDMGRKPTKKHSLDRRDNDGDYTPENCRWANDKTQGRNRRTSKFLTYNGETKTMIEWAEEFGIIYPTLQARLRRGWSMEKSLNTPVKPNNKQTNGE